MTAVTAGTIGLAITLAAPSWKHGLVVTAFLWQPVPTGIVMANVLVGRRLRRLARLRVLRHREADQVELFAELVSLGLAAGLPFLGAAELAAAQLDSGLGARQVLREARSEGAAAALAAADGPLGPLFRLVSRSMRTGAPVASAVRSFAASARKEKVTRRHEEMRRLPVRLLLPLAFLILPGFIVLTLGPALLSGLDKLQI